MTAAQTVFWITAACLTAGTTGLLVRPLPRSRGLSLALSASVPLAALALYAALGRPGLTAWHTRPVLPAIVAGAVARLTEETKAHPADAAAWIMLGDVDRRIQRFEDAEAAYRRALALQPGDPGLHVALAETMLAEDGGHVTPAIAVLLSAAPSDPVARYYRALAKSQAADWPGALADWQALRLDLSPDSVLLPMVDAQIDQARRVTGAVEDR